MDKEKVFDIIFRNLEQPKPVNEKSNLREDLGVDSLATIMIINDLEDEFDVMISEEDFADVVTAGDIIRKLAEHFRKKS